MNKDMKKRLEKYMSLNYRMELVEDPYEGGYAISYPDLRGCLSCGDTIKETIENGEDAKRQWLIAAIEDGASIPEPLEDCEFSGQFRLRMPKSLHKYLADRARAEGISMNQYCIFLLSQNVGLQ